VNKTPAVQAYPENIPKDQISGDGTNVNIINARVQTQLTTRMGLIGKAFILIVELPDKKQYSQVFSVDKPQVTGSAARVIKKLYPKLNDADELFTYTDKQLNTFAVKTLTVANHGGKLYWQ
jgi:hypothetical protein